MDEIPVGPTEETESQDISKIRETSSERHMGIITGIFESANVRTCILSATPMDHSIPEMFPDVEGQSTTNGDPCV